MPSAIPSASTSLNKSFINNNQSCPPSELLDQLLSDIRQWQPASMAQKDDITLIAIDVV